MLKHPAQDPLGVAWAMKEKGRLSVKAICWMPIDQALIEQEKYGCGLRAQTGTVGSGVPGKIHHLRSLVAFS